MDFTDILVHVTCSDLIFFGYLVDSHFAIAKNITQHVADNPTVYDPANRLRLDCKTFDCRPFFPDTRIPGQQVVMIRIRKLFFEHRSNIGALYPDIVLIQSWKINGWSYVLWAPNPIQLLCTPDDVVDVWSYWLSNYLHQIADMEAMWEILKYRFFIWHFQPQSKSFQTRLLQVAPGRWR